MTFGAGTPFNPYSVPAENTGTGGLSLYYVSKGDEEARLGRVDPWIAPDWQAKIDDRTAESLDRDLRLDDVTVPKGSTVRLYRDSRFGRPGFDDVYFVPKAGPVRPVRTPGVFSIGGALTGLGVFAFVRVGRRSYERRNSTGCRST